MLLFFSSSALYFYCSLILGPCRAGENREKDLNSYLSVSQSLQASAVAGHDRLQASTEEKPPVCDLVFLCVCA